MRGTPPTPIGKSSKRRGRSDDRLPQSLMDQSRLANMHLQAHPRVDAALEPHRSGAGDVLCVGASGCDEILWCEPCAFRRNNRNVGQIIQERNDAATKSGDVRERVDLATPIGCHECLAELPGRVGWREVPRPDRAVARERGNEVVKGDAA